MISVYSRVLTLACMVRDRLRCLLKEHCMSCAVKSQVEQAERDMSEMVDVLEGRSDKKK